jgi:hypothetical protein
VVGEHGHGAPTTFPQGRGAELLVSQFLMRAAITHVRRPALTIRSADRTSELVQRVGEQNVRSDDIVVPLENRELGGASR